eukprot:scpid37840/ scgid18408/ CWF19-like protein 2
MSGIAFVSKTSLDKEKRRKREAREAALEQAKEAHERKLEKAERKAAVNTAGWISSGFSARLDADKRIHGVESGSDSDTPKKKKKSKKPKKEKHKKKKKEKKSHGSGGSSGSEDSAGEWMTPEEATAKASAKPPSAPSASTQRDSWMLEPSAGDFFSSLGRAKAESEAQRKRREEEEEKKNMLDTPGQHPMELNKYWKDGGTGLPPEEEQARRASAAQVATKIGDGGKSWIRRAYQRAVEQAEREGRTLAEVAAERWGSLEKLESLLAAADGGSSRYGGRGRDRHSGPRYGDRHRSGGDRRSPPPRRGDQQAGSGGACGGFRRPGEDAADDSRSRPGTFRRPGDDGDRRSSSSRGFHRPGDDDDRRTGSGGSRSFSRPDEDDDHRHSSRSSGHDSYSASSHRHSRRSRERSESPVRRERRDRDSASPPPHRHARHSPDESRRSAHGHARAASPSNRDRDRGAAPAVVRTVGSSSPSSSTAESSAAIVSGRSAVASSTVSAAPPPAAAPVPSAPAEPAVTEAQLNALGAKIVKAELMGNTDLASRLQQKLTTLQERKKQQDQAGAPGAPQQTGASSAAGRPQAPGTAAQQTQHRRAASNDDEEVLLTRTDRHGNVRPAMGTDDFPQGKRQRQKKVATHSEGQRDRYFADDDKFTLSEMVAREKLSTAEDMNSALHRMSGRFVEKTNDDDYTLDDMYESRAARKQQDGKEEVRDMRKAMTEHRRSAAALDRCNQCIDSTRFNQQLVIAMGIKVYLSVPDHVPLTDGHCILAPSEHSLSFVAVDEEVVQEIRVFQKGLVAMFKERDEDIIFLETCYLHKRRHMIIECIPVPKEVGDMAPIYFKKAIMESEGEWSENKKLVDTRGKDLRKSIPKGFSYFSVEFGLDGGFAHPIEDDDSFSWYFGREIIGGIMDADPQLWRKPRHLGPAEQKRKIMNFSSMWEPYDWTKRLHQ